MSENATKSSSSIFETLSRFSRRGSMFDAMDSSRRSSMFDSSVSFASSQGDLYKKQKKRKNYENTYQLGPNGTPGLVEIRQEVEKLLTASCLEVDYALIDPGRFVKSLTKSAHEQLKELVPPRYRFTVQVVLIENAGQDVAVGSKWLWNTATDTCLTVRHQNKTMSAVVIIHLLYLE